MIFFFYSSFRFHILCSQLQTVWKIWYWWLFWAMILSKSCENGFWHCLQNCCIHWFSLFELFHSSLIKKSFLFLTKTTNEYEVAFAFQSYNSTSLPTTKLRNHYATSKVDLWYQPEKILWNFSGKGPVSGSPECEMTST